MENSKILHKITHLLSSRMMTKSRSLITKSVSTITLLLITLTPSFLWWLLSLSSHLKFPKLELTGKLGEWGVVGGRWRKRLTLMGRTSLLTDNVLKRSRKKIKSSFRSMNSHSKWTDTFHTWNNETAKNVNSFSQCSKYLLYCLYWFHII